MRIAVLIPVYNAGKYLRECLDSALAAGEELARTGEHGLEIFCCDDGSRDASREILQEYATSHANIRFVVQENAGVTTARNRLLDELPPAIEAFAFLDADDAILPGMYRKLVEAMDRTAADVAECEWGGAERVLDDMSVFLLRRTAPGRWINVINKLYRRSAVAGMRFRKGLAFEEDFFYNLEIHQAIRRKVLVPGRFYFYRRNPDSATNALNQRRYFESTTRRIRLSCEEFLASGRIPAALEAEFRRELAKDAYRMCLRKNLRQNRDAALRRELFDQAGEFFFELERTAGFRPVGLNAMQRLIYRCARSHRYRLARLLSVLV